MTDHDPRMKAALKEKEEELKEFPLCKCGRCHLKSQMKQVEELVPDSPFMKVNEND